MSRIVPYSLVARHSIPADKLSVKKYYPVLKSTNTLTIRELSAKIQAACTVNKADISAVLSSLEDVFEEALQRGEIIRFGDIGSFRLGIHSEGALVEKKFNSSLIKSVHVVYTPGYAIKRILKNVAFGKTGTAAEESPTEGQTEPDVDQADDTSGE